jgi:PleD family two-component response regulator
VAPIETTPSTALPVVLVASDQEPLARSLQGILSATGYAFLRTRNCGETLERGRECAPDGFLIDLDLPRAGGSDTCRALRIQPAISRAAPIVIVAGRPVPRRTHMQGLRAGAWDVIGSPMDPEAVALKLTALVAAKKEADAARTRGLLDVETGLYNHRGILARAAELVADARRHGRPLGIIACAAEPVPVGGWRDAASSEEAMNEWIRLFSRTLALDLRTADALGRLSRRTFIIAAPHTDPAGALELGKRVLGLARGFVRANSGLTEMRVHVGCFAIADLATEPADAQELITRAATALRRARESDTELCTYEAVW